jgi:putative sigma-54 modulation protein
MQIEVTFKNMDSSKPLREYVEKRLSKIAKHIDRPVDAHVVLSVEKIRQKAEVTLNIGGTAIKAAESSEDMYAAIDLVMDKLERQVSRYKEKTQNKKGSSSKEQIAQEITSYATEERPRVIHEKDYFVKPMSLEEAVLQMGLADKGFILFRNTDTNQVNLLYRREDGDLGLIIET